MKIFENLTTIANWPSGFITPAAELDSRITELRLNLAKVGSFSAYNVIFEGSPYREGPWAPIYTFAIADAATNFPGGALLSTGSAAAAAFRAWAWIRCRVTTFTGTKVTSVNVGPTFSNANQTYPPGGAQVFTWQTAQLTLPPGVPPLGGWRVLLVPRLLNTFQGATLISTAIDEGDAAELALYTALARGYAVLEIRVSAKNDTSANVDEGFFRDPNIPIAGQNLDPLTMPKAQFDVPFGIQFARRIAPNFGLNPNAVVVYAQNAAGSFPVMAPFMRASLRGIGTSNTDFSDVPNGVIMQDPVADWRAISGVAAVTHTPFVTSVTWDSLNGSQAATYGAALNSELALCSPANFLGLTTSVRAAEFLRLPVYLVAAQDSVGPAGAASFNSNLGFVTPVGANGFSLLGAEALNTNKFSNHVAAWQSLMLLQAFTAHIDRFLPPAERADALASKWLNFTDAAANPTNPAQATLVNSLITSRLTSTAVWMADALDKINARLGLAPYTAGVGPALTAYVQPIGR
jgi:hypothetical protein